MVGCGVVRNARNEMAVVLLMLAIELNAGAFATRGGDSWRDETTWQRVPACRAKSRPVRGLPDVTVSCASAVRRANQTSSRHAANAPSPRLALGRAARAILGTMHATPSRCQPRTGA